MKLSKAILLSSIISSSTLVQKCLASSSTLREENDIGKNPISSDQFKRLRNEVAVTSPPTSNWRKRGRWPQVGNDILGDNPGDNAGVSTAISFDGKRIAIGSNLNDDNGKGSGHVRIFQEVNEQWFQVGKAIGGEKRFDRSGLSIDMSDDGKIVIIGAPWNDGNGDRSGQARVYKEVDGSWVQLGGSIEGEFSMDELGRKHGVKISGDGTRVIAGSPGHAGVGHIRIFQLIQKRWVQIGKAIDGLSQGDRFGFHVDISQNGKRVVAGAPSQVKGNSPGFVRVYEEIEGTWMQIGSAIKGEENGDAAGWAVKISENGSRVVVGAPWHDANNQNIAGLVRIYEEKYGAWTKVGNDIVGLGNFLYTGYDVDISGDGTKVIVRNRSSVIIYEERNGQWKVIFDKFVGGGSVRISRDGWRAIIGNVNESRNWDWNSNYSGVVRVFEDKNAPAPTQSPTQNSQMSSKGTKKTSKSPKAKKAPKAGKNMKSPKTGKDTKSHKDPKAPKSH